MQNFRKEGVVSQCEFLWGVGVREQQASPENFEIWIVK